MVQGLERFGKVEQNKQIGDHYHIMITNGFDRNMRNTMACMKVVIDSLPEFPIVVKCKSDINFFHLILTKK